MKLRTTAAATLIAAAATLTLVAPANAAVTFDSATGAGFVGKGDVQLALGWNNKQLQDNAGNVSFAFEAVTVQETSWTCTNENNGNVQERARTTTTTVAGIASHIARERNQVTGFNLTGYAGGSSTSSSTEGPHLNSCPTNWTLGDSVVGDLEVVSGGLKVNGVPIG